MFSPLYWTTRLLLAGLQMLPMQLVARLGRACGALAYRLDPRHRRVAMENLTACFGAEKSPAEIRAIARENFRRIGENFASAAKTASFSTAQIRACVEWTGAEHLARHLAGGHNAVAAIGHFGNFELYAHTSLAVPGFQCATTYRALPHPALDALIQQFRLKSGCLFFERRRDKMALRQALNQQRLLLGLLVDQHAGGKGLPVPFFGRTCSTSAAPVLFAQRYHAPLHIAICHRLAVGRWQIEISPEIPVRHEGHLRPVEEVCAEINRAYEAAIRRDPANWFWVHRRWKTSWRHHNPVAPGVGAGSPASPSP